MWSQQLQPYDDPASEGHPIHQTYWDALAADTHLGGYSTSPFHPSFVGYVPDGVLLADLYGHGCLDEATWAGYGYDQVQGFPLGTQDTHIIDPQSHSYHLDERYPTWPPSMLSTSALTAGGSSDDQGRGQYLQGLPGYNHCLDPPFEVPPRYDHLPHNVQNWQNYSTEELMTHTGHVSSSDPGLQPDPVVNTDRPHTASSRPTLSALNGSSARTAVRRGKLTFRAKWDGTLDGKIAHLRAAVAQQGDVSYSASTRSECTGNSNLTSQFFGPCQTGGRICSRHLKHQFSRPMDTLRVSALATLEEGDKVSLLRLVMPELSCEGDLKHSYLIACRIPQSRFEPFEFGLRGNMRSVDRNTRQAIVTQLLDEKRKDVELHSPVEHPTTLQRVISDMIRAAGSREELGKKIVKACTIPA